MLGGFIAWALQFVANLAFSFAQCNSDRWRLPIHSWEIGLGSAAIAAGLAAEAAALTIFLRTRDADDTPPTGRIHFLATVGLTVNFLAIAIMVLTTVGAPLLRACRQS